MEKHTKEKHKQYMRAWRETKIGQNSTQKSCI